MVPRPEPREAGARAVVGLDSLGLELLLRICSFLAPADLGALASVSRQFGSASTTDDPDRQSLVMEVARRWLQARPAYQLGWIAHLSRASWLQQMQQVWALQAPLIFSRAGEGIELSNDGLEATQTANNYNRAAASEVVMSCGVHHAWFTVQQNYEMWFGVVRPTFDVENDVAPQFVTGHSFYYTETGRRFPDGERWDGQSPAREGDTITMELDLDAGTLSMPKPGEKLRVMADGRHG